MLHINLWMNANKRNFMILIKKSSSKLQKYFLTNGLRWYYHRLYFTVTKSGMKIICVLLIAIVSLVLADQTFEIDGIGYWISDSVQKNWYGAFRACYQRGMYLIDFETLEEYQKVKQYLEQQHPMTSQSYWTSGIAMGTKRKSEFYWAITGMTLGFNAFGPGQPDNAAGNEFCVEIQRQMGFQWNDKACREQKAFICRATRYFKLDAQISPDPIRQLL